MEQIVQIFVPSPTAGTVVSLGAGGHAMTINHSNWNLDIVHSGINFSVRHMVVSKVRGRFTKFTGNIALDESDLARSVVEATIEAGSIDTGTAQRDDHLRSADFFDVEHFPQIRFRSA